jgi:hypothetical protein
VRSREVQIFVLDMLLLKKKKECEEEEEEGNTLEEV